MSRIAPPGWHAVNDLLSENKLDAFLTTHLPNVRYLTGFTGSNGAVLVQSNRLQLFTDPRYAIQSRQEVSCAVNVVQGPLLEGVSKVIERRGLRRIGFESNYLTHAQWTHVTDKLPRRSSLIPVSGVVENLRIIKSAAEIEAIEASVRLNSEAFTRAVKQIRSGIREQELAAEVDYQMRLLGATAPAFETIVAFGERSALPHAAPTGARLGREQLILVDMGAFRRGYASDMTRMLYCGTPKRRAKQLYNAVLEAQMAAISEIREGIAAAQIDRVARQTLRAHGFDKLFVHSTGHGLGLEIHEAPRLGHTESAILRAGMVVTVEPGAYWEGFGGIRIEDTVVVTSGGCRNLTPTSKDLMVV